MSFIVYQIGDVPLFYGLSSINGGTVEMTNNREWLSSAVELIGTSGSISTIDPARPTTSPSTFEIKGSLVCDETEGNKLFSRLMSFGGVKNVPIIIIKYDDCIHDSVDICCSACNSDILWLISYGTIKSIQNKVTHLSSAQPWSHSVFDLSMTIDIAPSWRVISPWEWEYRRYSYVENTLSPLTLPETNDTLFYIPKKLADLTKSGYFYRWGTPLANYTPLYWGLKYTDGRLGGYGSDFVTPGGYPFYSDPSIWSATPNSVYAFTDFSSLTSGKIYTRVRRKLISMSEELNEESYIDISTLSTDLVNAGYSGLQASDIIITGYARPYPGFLIRNAEIIPSIRPRIAFTGSYPGETGIGYNDVTFYGDGVNFQVAFLHEYGRY